jgi:effector-binding domain-containing protein
MTKSDYPVSVENVSPRPIAAVKVRLPIDLVPSQFARYLNQVYDAARNGMVSLDGQNIFVYRGIDARDAEIDFGVGATKPFPPIGAVTYTEAPGGKVATTTHVGDYSALGHAHDAVVTWCREHGYQLAGVRWEVYGHWDPDAQPRTDIYYLLSKP